MRITGQKSRKIKHQHTYHLCFMTKSDTWVDFNSHIISLCFVNTHCRQLAESQMSRGARNIWFLKKH